MCHHLLNLIYYTPIGYVNEFLTIFSLQKLCLIDGYESNEFKPQGEATRAETAKLLSVLEL